MNENNKKDYAKIVVLLINNSIIKKEIFCLFYSFLYLF